MNNTKFGTISIIMTCYNTPMDKVEKAITSVINQTYEDLSFIFIDDWSTINYRDEFEEKMKSKWTTKRDLELLHIVHKPQSSADDPIEHNHGHSFCMNWALDLVTSIENAPKYVMFVDSDDELSPCAVKLLMEPMNNDLGIDISVGNYTRDERIWQQELKAVSLGNTRSDYKPIELSRYEALFHLCDPYMLPGHKQNNLSIPLCATWNKIFKLNVFNGVKFPNGKLRDDNFTAHYLIWNARKISYTPKITYYYRRGGQLADSNLYKTYDIVEAHRDRIIFFERNSLYEMEDDVVTKDNFTNKCMFARAKYNEIFVMLWSYIKFLEHYNGDISEKNMYFRSFKNTFYANSIMLLNFDPKFAAFVIEFIEKFEMKLNIGG